MVHRIMVHRISGRIMVQSSVELQTQKNLELEQNIFSISNNSDSKSNKNLKLFELKRQTRTPS